MEASIIETLTTLASTNVINFLPTISLEDNSETEELKIVQMGVTIANSLSILGCLFNFVTTIVLKTYKLSLGKMVIALSFMDFIGSVVSLFSNIKTDNHLFCNIQGFFWFFGTGGSFAWTACFAHGLYVSTKYNNLSLINESFKSYVIGSTAVAFILGIAGGLCDFFILEPDLKTCYHRTARNGMDWTGLFLMVIPTIGTLLYCGYCYITAMGHLRRSLGTTHLTLLLYPFLLILCQFPGLAVMLAIQISEEFAIPLWILFISNFMLNSQGFWNAFAYGLSDKIIAGYKRRCCHRRGSEYDDDEYEEGEEETEVHGIQQNLTHASSSSLAIYK